MNEDVWINQWGCGRDKLIFSHGESNARGVMIAVRESLDIKVISVFKDNNGRFIIMYAMFRTSHFSWSIIMPLMMREDEFKLYLK